MKKKPSVAQEIDAVTNLLLASGELPIWDKPITIPYAEWLKLKRLTLEAR